MNEITCKTHPDAPHGFLRNASHTEGRYVCECEYWKEPEIKTTMEMATQVYGECDWHKSALHHLEAFAALVRADEREACAKVCEDLGMATNGMYERNHECATAIRARGNT